MQMARQHTQALQAQALDAATLAKFATSVKDSLQEQQKIDAAEQGSFEDFVAQYYA